MDTLFIILALVAFFAMLYFVVQLVLDIVKKRPAKPNAKKMGIAFVVMIVAFIGFGNTRSPEQIAENQQRAAERQAMEHQEQEARDADEKATKEEKAEPEKRKETSKKSPTFHITPVVFQQKFNEYLHTEGGQLGESGMLDIGDPVVQSGATQDVVQYTYDNLNLILQQHIDKNTGEINEVFVTSVISGKDADAMRISLASAVMIYIATIKTIDPNVDASTMLEKLGIGENISELAKDAQTSENGVMYFKRVIKGVGIAFGATAK